MQTLAHRSLEESEAWALLKALAARARAGRPVTEASGVHFENGTLELVPPKSVGLVLLPGASPAFEARDALAPEVERLLELYLPLCLGEQSRELVLAHVGQSLDGQIATLSGAARYVTGPENLRHVHRLRALFDAVIVGASTVDLDDPKLTTRLVDGPNPARVVIDPALRLPLERGIFHDGEAETVVLCAAGAKRRDAGNGFRCVELPLVDGILAPQAVLQALAGLGLRRVFIEGGGVTLSRFFQERAIDRLHVTVAPLFVGRGRPGIMLPGVERIEHALRPKARRFELGADVLFDCELQRLRR
jgi:diaminohydroxyphosphoribosylaminopyrimidine deaminase / 5-amino-6-(5-phosphoribosylamino)uracil reductase